MKIMKQDAKIQKLIVVMKHVRQQTYTPEQLCERQRILDAQYFLLLVYGHEERSYMSATFYRRFYIPVLYRDPDRAEGSGNAFEVCEP